MLNPGKDVTKKDPIDDLKDLLKYSTSIDDGDKSALLNISNDSYNWRFVTARDTNSRNGFYGCALETYSKDNPSGKGDLMVAFRGSENMGKYTNLKEDWDKADLGLLNHDTFQHVEAERFAQQLIDEGVIDEFSDSDINVSGHSLGGNNAAHFTIYCSEEKREIFDRIDKCYNADGPGFTEEYIASHEPNVREAGEKIYHYKASFVGNLLKELPTEHVRRIHVDDEKINGGNIPVINRLAQLAFRHDTKNWNFNDDGSLVFDEDGSSPDDLSEVCNIISNGIDNLDVESLVYFASSFVISWILEGDEYGDTRISTKGFITLLPVLLGAVTNPVIVNTVISIAIIVAVINLNDKFQLSERAEEAFRVLNESLKSVSSKSQLLAEELYTRVKNYFKSTSETVSKIINPGYSAATSNPTIKLDTNTLRSCATRIYNANQRLANLDQRIKYLYMNVGLVDIVTLFNADLSIGYSYTLQRCSEYLQDTANDFEKTEERIRSAFYF